MSQLSMSKQERETFLAALHVGVLAVDRPDGPPLMVPIWYRYTAGGVVEFNTEGSSEKVRLLKQAGHAALCAQQEELPYAYVTVDGPVEVESTDRETRVDIATRYLGHLPAPSMSTPILTATMLSSDCVPHGGGRWISPSCSRQRADVGHEVTIGSRGLLCDHTEARIF